MAKQEMTVPRRLPGESAADYDARVAAWATDNNVRSKVDLREWTGSYPFHLSKEP